MLFYKINVLKALSKAGYPQKKIREEKIIEEAEIIQLKENKMIENKTLEKICDLLNMQPGEIIGNIKRDISVKKITNVSINILAFSTDISDDI